MIEKTIAATLYMPNKFTNMLVSHRRALCVTDALVDKKKQMMDRVNMSCKVTMNNHKNEAATHVEQLHVISYTVDR